MAKYAEGTNVDPEKTMAEIKQTLKRYGADRIITDEGAEQFAVAFQMAGRRFRVAVPIPAESDFRFRSVSKEFQRSGKIERKVSDVKSAHEQAIRQRYRALLLVIKAKLESVESGIETFDQAFMAHLLLPDGKTMAEWMAPQMDRLYVSGKMPPLLASGEQ